jgi:N-acetylneuraminic acid mutarotase/predicted RNase H-like HicB family nuclease
MHEIVFTVSPCENSGQLVALWDAPGCGGISTQGRSLDELRINIREALECHFETDRVPTVFVCILMEMFHRDWREAQVLGLRRVVGALECRLFLRQLLLLIGTQAPCIAPDRFFTQGGVVIRLLPLLCLTSLACANDALSWKQLPPLPESLGVAAPFAGTSGGALLVGGGANFPDKMPWEGGAKVWHDRVYVLERPDTAWRAVGKLPQSLAYGVSVTHRDRVVCVGGSDASGHYAQTFRLVWKDGALATEPLPALPIALSGASGALVGDSLIVACGSEKPGEQAASNRAFALDLAAKEPAWRELPALPGKPRLLATAGAENGTFYMFGGCALEADADGKVARHYLREAWSYREADGWKRLADLPKPSVAAPAPAPFLGGRFLLLSGDDGSKVGFQPLKKHPGFLREILAYDPALDRWNAAGEVAAARATVPCVDWRGRFVIPSGEVRPGVRSPEVWTIAQP